MGQQHHAFPSAISRLFVVALICCAATDCAGTRYDAVHPIIARCREEAHLPAVIPKPENYASDQYLSAAYWRCAYAPLVEAEKEHQTPGAAQAWIEGYRQTFAVANALEQGAITHAQAVAQINEIWPAVNRGVMADAASQPPPAPNPIGAADITQGFVTGFQNGLSTRPR